MAARTTMRRTAAHASGSSFGAGMTSSAFAASPASGDGNSVRKSSSKSVVLVHGGWHGGWAFSALRERLRPRAKKVIAPTLSGLGERSHLSGCNINLNTHISDVVAVLEYEDLSDVVLCGHSYGGMVITGVADAVPERIAALVYLDAAVPSNGDSLWSILPDEFHRIFIEGARATGYMTAPPPRLHSRAHVTSHPIGSILQSIHLSGRAAEVKTRVFVLAESSVLRPFHSTHARLKNDPSWIVRSLPCGHDIPNEMTDAAADLVTDLTLG
jgi:pimeloyl-ACP methyl ester carboxylesterase